MSVCFEWNFVHMLNQRDECLERKKEIETIIQKKKIMINEKLLYENEFLKEVNPMNLSLFLFVYLFIIYLLNSDLVKRKKNKNTVMIF